MRSFWVVLVAAFAACGRPEKDLVEPISGPSTDDPAGVPSASSMTLELRMPEALVSPHTVQNNCAFLEPTTEDLFVRALTPFQGASGEGVVLFQTRTPVAAGTVRACDAMDDLVPVMSRVSLPQGLAIRIAKGTQLVLRQRLMNSGDTEIVTHDLVQLERLDAASVTKVAGFYALSGAAISLPRRSEIEVGFDCTASADLQVLQLATQMHALGSGSQLAPAQFPFTLAKGASIATHCTFLNDSTDRVVLPGDQCATYGYFVPASDDVVWSCRAME